jgi:protein-disulfide isomerase
MRREQAGQRSRSGRGRSDQPTWRSPTVLISLAAVVVGIIVIAALNLPRGSGGAVPTGSGSATGGSSVGLTAPAVSIPAGVPRDGRTLGAASAKVSFDVWEDFQCPACGNFSETIEPVIIQRFVVPGKIRYTFHDFAFLGPESLDAASAARCAGQQGKFWDYHGWLYANQSGENQGWFSRDRLAAIADRVGLDRAAWDACYDGGSERSAVTSETQAGQSAGVSGTPTLFLAGKLVPLSSFTSWDDLYRAIDAAVAAAGSATSPSAPPASPSVAPSAAPSAGSSTTP